ncbi:DUF4917 family protein [Novosphingobium sp. NBM11]|uniref:DUF4917 family protein n=1 Tax=Novosphingobium sp. NBM11 TaxID=2596914 RepID=UPI0018923654|nr:DUF4917 family protein [Novosphingobium sp. NBM11]MBF5090583.1 DUF4917 family protein [Novosphingobium sp. NBM11]
MGGLVQQQAVARADRQYPARRSRRTILHHAGRHTHRSITQAKWPPAISGRFTENDDRILTRMARGKFQKLYVGIYGDPATQDNQRIMNRANELAAHRHEKSPLEVAFYEAATARVWG